MPAEQKECFFCSGSLQKGSIAKHTNPKYGKQIACPRLRKIQGERCPGKCSFCGVDFQEEELGLHPKCPKILRLEEILKLSRSMAPLNSIKGIVSLNNYPGPYKERVDHLSTILNHAQLAKPYEWHDFLPDALSVLQDRQWDYQDINYTLALEEKDLQRALENSLYYPVFIPAGSSLGQRWPYVNNQKKRLPEIPLPELIGHVLHNDQMEAAVNGLSEETPAPCKSYGDIRDHFAKNPESRDLPWTCLQLPDTLFSNFAGPDLIRSQDLLRQIESDSSAHETYYINNQGEDQTATKAQDLGQWLLISEKGSVNKSDLNKIAATWMRCIRGEKIFLFQNEVSSFDCSAWKLLSNCAAYRKPWAVITLKEGDCM